MNKNRGNITYVGIDPAFRENGFVVCEIYPNSECKFRTMQKFANFIEWLDMIKTQHKHHEKYFVFCIENSYLQKETFDMSGGISVVARKSRNVGMNMAVSQIVVDCISEYFPIQTFQISPKEKGAKWSEVIFSATVKSDGISLLNYKGLKNEQDKRDAYQIAKHGYYLHQNSILLDRARRK